MLLGERKKTHLLSFHEDAVNPLFSRIAWRKPLHVSSTQCEKKMEAQTAHEHILTFEKKRREEKSSQHFPKVEGVRRRLFPFLPWCNKWERGRVRRKRRRYYNKTPPPPPPSPPTTTLTRNKSAGSRFHFSKKKHKSSHFPSSPHNKTKRRYFSRLGFLGREGDACWRRQEGGNFGILGLGKRRRKRRRVIFVLPFSVSSSSSTKDIPSLFFLDLGWGEVAV